MKPMGHFPSILRKVRSTLAGQDGIALLMVLVVITILATLVVSFTDTTQKHLQVTQYYKNRLKAYWAAQSGLQAAVGLLRASAMAPQAGADGATSPWNYESDAYQQVVPLLLSTIFCESSMLEPALLLTETYSRAADLGLSRTPAAVPILDENRKLSIYGLVTSGTTGEDTDEAVFNRFAYLLQYLLKESDFATEEQAQAAGTMSYGLQEETRIDIERARTLARYLVDWMDTENNKSTTDYNSDTAEQSCPEDGLPYEAKNGRLDSIDEIGLVCGFRQLPHTTIQRLTRHLTAYDLTTNINTASLPVLHAFCAASQGPQGGMENETESEKIYPLLHYDGNEETVDILGSKSYGTLLSSVGIDQNLTDYLQRYTDIKSTIFQVAVYGLVKNMETMTDLARCRLQMDLKKRDTGGQFDLLYYRED